MTHAFFIRGSDGSESDLNVAAERMDGGDVRWIEVCALCYEYLVGVHNFSLPGSLHKAGLVVGMGNVNQDLCPLSDGTALQSPLPVKRLQIPRCLEEKFFMGSSRGLNPCWKHPGTPAACR